MCSGHQLSRPRGDDGGFPRLLEGPDMQPFQTPDSGIQGLCEVQFSGHGAGGDPADLIGFPGALGEQIDGLGACDG